MFDDYLESKRTVDTGTMTSAALHLKTVMDLNHKHVSLLGGPHICSLSFEVGQNSDSQLCRCRISCA